jgi:type II secretory pathway pseudopilin PulG
VTLVELLLVITLIGILAGLAVTRSAALLDAVAVRGAQQEVVALFGFARDAALGDHRATAIHIDRRGAQVVAARGSDTLATLHFAERGIRLVATRDSMTYAASGLGFGAANLRLELIRGSRAETVTVSRLGRVEAR